MIQSNSDTAYARYSMIRQAVGRWELRVENGSKHMCHRMPLVAHMWN